MTRRRGPGLVMAWGVDARIANVVMDRMKAWEWRLYLRRRCPVDRAEAARLGVRVHDV